MTRRVIQRPKQKKNVSRFFFFFVGFSSAAADGPFDSRPDDFRSKPGRPATEMRWPFSPFHRTSTNLLKKNDYKSHRGDLRPFDSSQVPPVGLSLGNQVVSQMFVNCRQTNRDAVNEQTTTTKIWKRTFRSGRIVWKMSGESVEPLCAQFSVGNDFCQIGVTRRSSFVFSWPQKLAPIFQKFQIIFFFFEKKKWKTFFRCSSSCFDNWGFF